MNIFKRISSLKPVPDETILAAMDPTMLGCAVGAYQNKLSTSGRLTFDNWWMCCETTWIPRVARQAGVSKSALKEAVLRFARANAHRDYIAVIEEQHAKRGSSPGVILKPGESITIKVPVSK